MTIIRIGKFFFWLTILFGAALAYEWMIFEALDREEINRVSALMWKLPELKRTHPAMKDCVISEKPKAGEMACEYHTKHGERSFFITN